MLLDFQESLFQPTWFASHFGLKWHYSSFKVGWNHLKTILCMVKHNKTKGWSAFECHNMNYQFFQAKSDLFHNVYEFWKYTQTLSPYFSPRKFYYWLSTMNFFVPSDHMNISTHIPTCFLSIWDGLKSIFTSLESAKFRVHSFKITILFHFHESSFQPISHWVYLPCRIVFQSN